jgi:hypothetical protein
MSAASIVQGSISAPKYPRYGSVVQLAVGALTRIVVADAAITANSIVVCWGIGAADATSTLFTVDEVIAGTGFVIKARDAATADKRVGWAVLQY